MRTLLFVGAGGFLGSVLRWLLSGLAYRLASSDTFPVGTLTVNVLGCLVIGLLGGLSESKSLFDQDLRAFLFLGLLGGFTTFSTFGYETLTLLHDGERLRAAANVLLHLILGLGAAWLGYAVTTS